MNIPLYVVILRYVASSEEVARHRDAHVSFMDSYFEKGIFFASGVQSLPYGGVILAKALNRETLLDILKEDPFQKAACAEYQIFEFTPRRTHPGFEEFLKGV